MSIRGFMMSISTSRTVTRQSPVQIFYPLGTVRCDGPVLFRDQLARDIACLLDVDDDALWIDMNSQSVAVEFHFERPVRSGRGFRLQEV